MNGKIDKYGNLHIERSKLGYVPCDCIRSNVYDITANRNTDNPFCGTVCTDKPCSHRCSHFNEPFYYKTAGGGAELVICHRTLIFDSLTDERGAK